jgi:class 3 adenylate cyclase
MIKSNQLTVIMFSDIVGNTSLMVANQKRAFEILDSNRELHNKVISDCNGKIIKELGDGIMASFSTVTNAINAAIKIQERCESTGDYQLRIGMHQGEVVVQNQDVFGHNVNLAARIQSAAEPGTILISETVHRNIANNTAFHTRFIKEQELKNVNHPVKLYQLLFTGSKTIEIEQSVIDVQEKSIAVLPFVNIGSDPE